MEEPITNAAVVTDNADAAAVVQQEEDFLPFEVVEEDGAGVATKKAAKEEDFDVDGEDKKIISKVVKQETEGFASRMDAIQNDMKIADFFSTEGNDIYKPYMEKIKSLASNPQTKGMKMDAIVALAIGPKALIKLGAERYQQAMGEAQGSRTGGSSNGGTPQSGMKNAWDVNPAEWAKIKEKFGV